MKPYYQEDRATIYCGDCIEIMADVPENSVDAIVTDPPYGLEFMGKEWDKFGPNQGRKDLRPSGQRLNISDFKDGVGRISNMPKKNPRCRKCGRLQFDHDKYKCQCETPDFDHRYSEYGFTYQFWTTQWATQALRVLKPGGYLLAFGGTRTEHRLKCGLEDAGFEIRDTICWLYGSGFPKNLDISKQIDKMAGVKREVTGQAQGHVDSTGNYDDDNYEWKPIYNRKDSPATEAAKEWAGWGTALKPAVEFVCVARKPLSEKTVAENILKWGTGGMDIDGARIGFVGEADKGNPKRFHKTNGGSFLASDPSNTEVGIKGGRWPANVILECTCEEVIETTVKDGKAVRHRSGGKTFGGNKPKPPLDDMQYGGKAVIHTDPDCPCRMLDEQSGKLKAGGNISGLEPSVPAKNVYGEYGRHQWQSHGDSGGASRFFYCAKASSSERGKNNKHPTCKPVALMEYLIKLVSRKDSALLDPFGGSMSTVLGAVAIGRRIIAIEQSEEYCEMLKGRCRQMVMELCYA